MLTGSPSTVITASIKQANSPSGDGRTILSSFSVMKVSDNSVYFLSLN